MLKVKDIFDRIILRSGQFILRNKNIELDVDNFRMLVEDALETYNDAHPYDELVDINFQGGRNYTFPDDFGTLKRPPDWISEAHPVGGFNGIQFHGHAHGGFGGTNHGGGFGNMNGVVGGQVPNSDVLQDPIQSPWVYNEITKTLTVSHADAHKVRIVNNHIIEELDLGNGKLEFCILTVSTRDQVLLSLIQGKFLQGIGRARNAFTLQDLPILMDSQDLISAGKEMEDESFEKLQNTQKFRLASGG